MITFLIVYSLLSLLSFLLARALCHVGARLERGDR